MLNVNPRQQTMEENIKWLMTSHQELDSRVFDANHQMLPEIRQKLLMRAQVVIDGCLKDFPWLQVDDIVLFGSSTTYEYQEFSDLDLEIVVSIVENNGVFKSNKQIFQFIGKVRNAFLDHQRKYRIAGRQVEIKIVLKVPDLAQYSVLYDKWLIYPQHKDMSQIDAQKVIARAQDIVEKIKYMMTGQFERPNGKYKVDDLQKMQDYYNFVVAVFHGSVEDWLAYKLVNYTGYVHRLRNFYTSQLAKTLSF